MLGNNKQCAFPIPMHAIILSPHTGVVTAQLKRALTVVSNSEPEPKRKHKIKPKEVCGTCKKMVQSGKIR